MSEGRGWGSSQQGIASFPINDTYYFLQLFTGVSISLAEDETSTVNCHLSMKEALGPMRINNRPNAGGHPSRIELASTDISGRPIRSHLTTGDHAQTKLSILSIRSVC